ncbi:hypothetical protein [Scopulibacillus cellulosilyticus]|uniref:ABC-2 type transport system permease protein n=1 Tax=Scopulibacillus cellulosilyticus TaxID=2665665 RepID=A0ABW2PTP9_9BACL
MNFVEIEFLFLATMAILYSLFSIFVSLLLYIKKQIALNKFNFKRSFFNWIDDFKSSIKRGREVLNAIKLSNKYRNKIFNSIFVLSTLSKTKWRLVIYGLSFGTVVFFATFGLYLNRMPLALRILIIIMIIILAYGFGEYISAPFLKVSTVKSNKFPNKIHKIFTVIFSNYIKLCLLALFCITILEVNIENNGGNLFSLLITVILTTIYSCLYLKFAIDSTRNWLFHIIIFLFMICWVFFIIGVAFGSYYLEHNDVFNMFSSKEVILLNHNFKWKHLYYMISMGLTPLFSLQSKFNIQNPLTLITLLEYLLGYIFTAIFVGFFVSYFSTKFNEKLKR